MQTQVLKGGCFFLKQTLHIGITVNRGLGKIHERSINSAVLQLALKGLKRDACIRIVKGVIAQQQGAVSITNFLFAMSHLQIHLLMQLHRKKTGSKGIIVTGGFKGFPSSLPRHNRRGFGRIRYVLRKHRLVFGKHGFKIKLVAHRTAGQYASGIGI